MSDARSVVAYSRMSQAAYLDWTPVVAGVLTFSIKLTTNDGFSNDTRFSVDQAESFTNRDRGHSFISHQPNTSNGTSATVFKSNDPSDASYTIAIRGTEALSTDLLEDIFGVVLAGKAKVQLLESFRFYKQLTTPGGNAVVYSDAELAAMAQVLRTGTPITGAVETVAASLVLAGILVANDKGAGDPGQTLIPAGSTINFTGHSLGGHVAYLLAQLVDATAAGSRIVGDVMTFNAPGENALQFELRNWLGLDISSQAGAIGSRHLAFYGTGGLNVTGGLGQVIGTRKPVFIEAEGWSWGNPVLVENHSIVKLSDSLALYDLISGIDPALKETDIGRLLDLGANRMADSLEATLDVLRNIFLGARVAPTKAPGSPDNRDDYYQNLTALQNSATFENYTNVPGGPGMLAGRVTPLIGLTQAQLVSAARADFGGFFALRILSPFALVNADSVYETSEPALQSYWRDDFLESDGGTARRFSNPYLQDRAAFLAWRIEKNRKDIPDETALLRRDGGVETLLFTDYSLGNTQGGNYSIRVTGGNVLQQIDPIRFSFAGDEGNALEGGSYGDHLYGGNGADTLTGGAGDDYLEGWAGADILAGGAGSDTLMGGAGFDTYLVAAEEEGSQTILDSDGQGRILIGGLLLGGGERAGGAAYVSAEEDHWFSFTGDLATGGTLTIDGRIVVVDFKNGDLGITLGEPEAREPASYEFEYFGSSSPEGGPDDLEHASGSDLADHFVSGGMDVAGEAFVPGGNGGVFLGKAGDDLFEGSRRFGDRLWGGPGDDTLYGAVLGDDPDAPSAEAPGDRLFGGAGSDRLVGGDRADVMDGDFEQIFMRIYAPYFDFQLGDATARLNADGLDSGAWFVRFGEGERETGAREFTSIDAALQYVLGISDSTDPEYVPGTSDSTDLDTLYDDDIDGGAGDDVIFGGNGSDIIFGGAGDDRIGGDADPFFYGRDRGYVTFGAYAPLLGEPGDDYIDGGDGDDTLTDLFGGSDVLLGGTGDDVLTNRDRVPREDKPGEPSFNRLDGGPGNDRLTSFQFAFGSDDDLLGGDGDDVIDFSGWSVTVEGGQGDDLITVSANDMNVDGGDGNDEFHLSNGSGVSRVKGGTGNDSIHVGAIDSLLIDQAGRAGADQDELIFEGGTALTSAIAPDDVFLQRVGNDLRLDLISASAITVIGWFADDTRKLSAIRFAGGAVWTPSDIAGLMANDLHVASAGADTLMSSASQPIVRGLAGDDRLLGKGGSGLLEGGDDADAIVAIDAPSFIAGGLGDDLINAGASGSIIAFNAGDGQDTLSLTGGTVSLGGGLSIDDVAFVVSGSDLRLDFGGGDSITLEYWQDLFAESAPQLQLQIVAAGSAELFDLGAASAELLGRISRDPDLTSWNPGTAWSAYALESSTPMALGGLLAYQYAIDGSTAALSADDIQRVLFDPDFALARQAIALPAAPPIELPDEPGDAPPADNGGGNTGTGGGNDNGSGNANEASGQPVSPPAVGPVPGPENGGAAPGGPVEISLPANIAPIAADPGSNGTVRVPLPESGSGSGVSQAGEHGTKSNDPEPGFTADAIGTPDGASGFSFVFAAEGDQPGAYTDVPSGFGAVGGTRHPEAAFFGFPKEAATSARASVPDVQIILDALGRFDAVPTDPTPGGDTDNFVAGRTANAHDPAPEGNPPLPSRVLIEALLAFHLESGSDAASGPDVTFYGRAGAWGASLDAAQMALGVPGFGRDAQQMQLFSGLQEGLRTLS